MVLHLLKTVPFIVIRDNYNVNILPIIQELSNNHREGKIQAFCYEGQLIFPCITYDEFNPCDLVKYTENPSMIIIDSLQQMILSLGWKTTLNCITKLKNNKKVQQLVIVVHEDCLFNTKLQTHIDHIANATISYDTEDYRKITLKIKKGGKLTSHTGILSYENISILDPSLVGNPTLKFNPINKEEQKVEAVTTAPSPASLSTFKIETDQSHALEKVKLKLPYMSKINEGGKVHYEPDAVDDWDDEDPDDDLEI